MSEATTTTTSAPIAAPAATKTEAAPDFSKMTGAEAKAYVESLKSKDAKPKTIASSEKKDPVTSNTVKEAVAEAVRKRKLKDDLGQEIEVDEAELEKTYISRKAHQREANKRFQEGQILRKQAEEFLQMMKDPEKFYEVAHKMGHDPRNLAEKYLAGKLEEELMDPREKELKDTKAKLREFEDMKKKEQEAVERQRDEALKAKYAKDYEQQFISALQGSGLPPTKPMVAEMAKYISKSAKLGFKMTADEAAQLVKEDVQIAHQRLIGDADGEMLIKLLGENVANKVRKYDTSKLKSPEQHLRTPQEQGEPRERKIPNKRMSAREWREFNRK